MSYAKGGVLPGYQNPVPTQENMKSSRGNPGGTYNSVDEVVAAYKEGNLSYTRAKRILTTRFGLTEAYADDLLTLPETPQPTPPSPEPEPEPEPEPQGEIETVDSGFTLSEDQRFLLIGLLVIGIGSRMIIKRD